MARFFLLLFIHLRLLIIYYTTTPSETVPIINSSRSLSASSNSNSNISNEGNNIIIITAKQPSKTYTKYLNQTTQATTKTNRPKTNSKEINAINARSVWQQVSTGYSRADSWTRGLSYIQHDSSSNMPNMHLPFSYNSFFANGELVTNSGLVDNNRRKNREIQNR